MSNAIKYINIFNAAGEKLHFATLRSDATSDMINAFPAGSTFEINGAFYDFTETGLNALFAPVAKVKKTIHFCSSCAAGELYDVEAEALVTGYNHDHQMPFRAWLCNSHIDDLNFTGAASIKKVIR